MRWWRCCLMSAPGRKSWPDKELHSTCCTALPRESPATGQQPSPALCTTRSLLCHRRSARRCVPPAAMWMLPLTRCAPETAAPPSCMRAELTRAHVADASAPAGATGVAAALLACWCGSQAHVISQRPRAALALSSALASFSKARAWHQAAQVADTLAAVAAHEPYRLASHSPGAQALRDAALAALGPTIPGDAAADAVATGVACTQALTLALDGRSSGEEPLYGAALSAVLPALAASPALQTTGAVGTQLLGRWRRCMRRAGWMGRPAMFGCPTSWPGPRPAHLPCRWHHRHSGMSTRPGCASRRASPPSLGLCPAKTSLPPGLLTHGWHSCCAPWPPTPQAGRHASWLTTQQLPPTRRQRRWTLPWLQPPRAVAN